MKYVLNRIVHAGFTKVVGIRLIVAILLLSFALGPQVCLADDRPDFNSLLQMHKSYGQAIKNGRLSLRRVWYQYRPPELIEQKRQAQQRGEPVSDIDLLPELRFDTYRDYVFDLNEQRYRLDEEPADPNLISQEPYSRIAHRKTSLTLGETQVELYRDTRWVIVDHSGGVIAQNLPIYIGLLTEKGFRKSPARVSTYEKELDGQAVVVYELTDPNEGDAMLQLYLDPAIGYRYRLMVGFYEGDLVLKVVAQGYKVFNGIPLPTYHEEVRYRRWPDGIKVNSREVIEVKEAAFNIDLDRRAFKITVDPDMTVMASFRFLPLGWRLTHKRVELGVEEIVDRILSAVPEED